MTRQEWFDNQTPKVQKQFKNNCDELNTDGTFNWWIASKVHATGGIGGAFVFADSPEGHRYWMDMHEKSLNEIENEN